MVVEPLALTKEIGGISALSVQPASSKTMLTYAGDTWGTGNNS